MKRPVLLFFIALPLFLALSDIQHRILSEKNLNSRLLSAISAGSFKDNSLLEVSDIEVGIDTDNKAYVYYRDIDGYEFGYSGLEETPSLHLHKLEHHSQSFRLIDDKHLISLLIHDLESQDITLSVWTFQEDKSALPSFHLSPRSLLRKRDVTEPNSRKLLDSSDSLRFVAYDYTGAFAQGSCAAMAVFEEEDEEGNVHEKYIKLDSPEYEYHQHHHGRILPPERITNCFEGEENTRVLDISFLADLGYFHSFESDLVAVQRSVEVIISNVNLIYFFQFNIHVRLQQLMVVTRSIGRADLICSTGRIIRREDMFSMSEEDDTCCANLEDTTSHVQRFSGSTRSGKPRANQAFVQITSSSQIQNGGSGFRAAHWHWLTDCFPADCGEDVCAVGQALVGLGCRFSGQNFGMSSRTFQTWLVVAHELAHNFGGAGHSFEDGRGRTGGLMDYGDGKIDGTYSFNLLRKNEFCSSIQSYIDNDLCQNFGSDYFARLSDRCGFVEDFDRDDSCEGICVNQTCVPLQLLVKVNTRGNTNDPNFFEETILTEPAEFSPIDISAENEIVVGELEKASPFNACSAVQDLSDKIAVVERGGCQFTQKVDNLLAANARAVIIFNNRGGAPKPVGGQGYVDLSVVSISRNDGLFLLDQMVAINGLQAAIGGFAASDENLDFIPPTFFEEYFIPIVSFMGICLPIVVIWFIIRTRDIIVDNMKKAAETVVDTAIDGKYHLINTYESVRQSFRYSRAAVNAEELRRLREQETDSLVV